MLKTLDIYWYIMSFLKAGFFKSKMFQLLIKKEPNMKP